jgi:hypothetical protein
MVWEFIKLVNDFGKSSWGFKKLLTYSKIGKQISIFYIEKS